MSAEQNKAIVRRFVEELWNKRNIGIADEIFAADCVTHQLQSGSGIDSSPRDPETLKKHVAEWLVSFPDLRFNVEQMVADNDRVVSQILMTGTHTGVWLGISPTGNEVNLRMMTIHRIADGKIVEDWVLVESLGFFRQLGLLPPIQEIMAGAAK